MAIGRITKSVCHYEWEIARVVEIGREKKENASFSNRSAVEPVFLIVRLHTRSQVNVTREIERRMISMNLT